MVDPADAIGKAREAVTQRAELPGMSLMEHLDELRKRIVHSGHLSCRRLLRGLRSFTTGSSALSRLRWTQIGKTLIFTHPMDPLNLYLQVSLIGGAILASPFILFQVWLFIAPGLYQKERRFVVPFMAATVGLFLAGAAFGYFWVLPGALKILIVDFGHNFTPMVTIEEYTGFFLSIILGLGISFEMPILIFFLAMFGIVSPKFLWKNIRYAILAVFLVAAIICPSPDPWTMCIYAIPMLALYMVGIGVAWWVHPSRRKKKEAQETASGLVKCRCFPRIWRPGIAQVSLLRRGKANSGRSLTAAVRAPALRPSRTSTAPRLSTTPASLSPSARAGPPARGTPRPRSSCATISSTTSLKKTPSPPTRPSAPSPCATSSCAFPAKRTASSCWPRTTRPTTRCEYQLCRRQRRRLDHRAC